MVGAQRVRERFRTDRSWVPTGGRAFHDRHAARERTIAQRIRRSSSRTRWLSLACSSLVCLARALVVRREESISFRMPPVANPLAAPPPIAVSVAANPSADKPVYFPANHPLVVKTAFLGYSDSPAIGGVNQKSLSTSQTVRAFGRRLSLTKTAPVPVIGPLQLAFTGAAWTKYLRELVASGLLQASFTSIEDLDSTIDGLTIVTPANLTVVPADLDPGEDTTFIAAIAGAPAVPGVGRRNTAGYVAPRPAVAAVPGRPMLYGFLNFLDATNLTLTDLELSGVAPWAGIVYLVGALGPCLTQAARNGAGPARLTATALANGINKAFGVALADEVSLAGETRGFLESLCTQLPVPFRCRSVETIELRTEFRDAIIYGQGREDRVRIETLRVHLIVDECAPSSANLRIAIQLAGRAPECMEAPPFSWHSPWVSGGTAINLAAKLPWCLEAPPLTWQQTPMVSGGTAINLAANSHGVWRHRH